jgi:dihydroorotate dehydrogenase (NAD+) catalytic subunit
MSLESDERKLLSGLADVLIPAGEGLPSASEAGVAYDCLDKVLEVRGDLLEPLKKLLARAKGQASTEVIAELQKNDPDAFGVLAEVVPGAYFLNADVRAKLKYEGQVARPIQEREDYLEDGLLQSVLDRGAIFRPTPPTAKRMRGYDWSRTYDWNYNNVPDRVKLPDVPVKGEWDFCGLKVESPLGIAAGPLLNGRWILYYASLGFDVLTYKTVRSGERASYELPNLQPVQSEALTEGGKSLSTANEMRGSWAVSFGMPSRAPAVWRADIERTRKALARNKILSVSVVATPQSEWSIDDVADDFAKCARWAVESGADCIEANFSCPNVASADAQLYQQPEAAGLVASRLREAVRNKPLLIKIGHITKRGLARSLARALAPHVDALVMVNCIPAKVVDQNRQVLFDGQARGIAGASIYDAALEQVRLFSQIIREEGLAIRLVGVGGISSVAQVRGHLEAGSHGVQLGTAAMLDPMVGQKIREYL